MNDNNPKQENETPSTPPLTHPQSPAEQQKGNSHPEHLHSTVKPIPDPIPGEHEKGGKKIG